MASLKDVAETAKVPLVTAYQALSSTALVEQDTRRAVVDAAAALGYKLNITIRDVADEAGVSIATVSYVLNDSAPVSVPTRQRVMTAVKALGYRPNSTARNLKASQTRMIGYAWHDVLPGHVNAILDRFIFCMAQSAESYGYHVLTFTQPKDNIVQTYEELINTNRVDGFVISNTNRDDMRIRRLLDMGVPFASFGRANDDWDFAYVDVDGHEGIRVAVQHLLDYGHQRIAFVGWPEGSLAGDARLQGYRDTLRAAGIEPQEGWIGRALNTVNDAYQAAQGVLKAQVRPTAIVCVNDTVALGVMRCLQASGIRVGLDVAITGFDDYPMSEYLQPPLTSLQQPIELITRQVIDLLMAQIEHRIVEKKILVAPSLIIRESSGPRRN